jgi:hypothetical protein
VASNRNGKVYVGVTSGYRPALIPASNRRGREFAKRSGSTMLVWFEPHERMDEAIAREKYNNSRVIARDASERRGDPGALLQPYDPELLRRDSPSEDGRLSAPYGSQ